MLPQTTPELTLIERAVLYLLLEGSSNPEAAGILRVSPVRISLTTDALFKKFGVDNKADLINGARSQAQNLTVADITNFLNSPESKDYAVSSPSSSMPNPKIKVVIGILNIVFSIVYLGCFVLSFAVVPATVERASQILGNDIVLLESSIGVVVNGLMFLGLLSAGIFLLQGDARGRYLTRLTALVAILFLLFEGCLSLTLMGQFSSYSGASASIIFSCGVVAVRFLYPLVAAAVLSPAPQDLGLR